MCLRGLCKNFCIFLALAEIAAAAVNLQFSSKSPQVADPTIPSHLRPLGKVVTELGKYNFI